MFGLVQADLLGFPACVPSECRGFDERNYAGSWATPVHQTLPTRSVPHGLQNEVLAVCPELLDGESGQDEESQIEVVAYALHFQKRGLQMTIITEDVLPLPYRASTADAARSLGMDVMTMADFMRARGL